MDELSGPFFCSDLGVFLEIESVFVGDIVQRLLLGLSRMLFLL